MLNKIYTVIQIALLPIFAFLSFVALFPINDYPTSETQKAGVNLFMFFGISAFPIVFVSLLVRLKFLKDKKTLIANLVGLAPIINILGIVLALSIYNSK